MTGYQLEGKGTREHAAMLMQSRVRDFGTFLRCSYVNLTLTDVNEEANRR